MAEGEGFEPSRELMTPYSLSRRAPSATRSALRTWSIRAGSSGPVGSDNLRREGTFGCVTPVEALERIAELLMRGRAPAYRQQAFKRAATAISRVTPEELQRLADAGQLTDIPNVGEKTATVIAEVLRGETPKYLQDLLANTPEPGSVAGDALRAQLRGDLHSHSDWSD